MTALMIILMGLSGTILFVLWWHACRQNIFIKREVSKWQDEQQILRDILRCPRYGIATQCRRVRSYNLALLMAPKPTPYIERLEQDIKLEVLFAKILLWGVNNTMLGTDDTAPVPCTQPDIYEKLAYESDEQSEYSSDIALLSGMRDEIHSKLNANHH